MRPIHVARARPAGVAAALLVALCATALMSPPRGEGQAAGRVAPLPLLGAADSEMVLMGSAPKAAPAETWGYRPLPPSVGSVVADGRALEFGPPADPLRPQPQLAFTRHTDASGWQVFETPLDEEGRPYRGPLPNRLSARTTAEGGGVLVGRDLSRPANAQVVLLYRSPGGRFRATPPPPADVLAPGTGTEPAEALAGDGGGGRVALTAFDEGDRTGVFIAPVGRPAEDAVLHYDGQGWTREPVRVPEGSEGDFRIVALAAITEDRAWAVAQADPALGRGILLLERREGADGAEWVELDLGESPFARRDTPAQGVTGVTPLGGTAQTLTAVEGGGLWIDGRLDSGGAAREFTLFFDVGAGRVTGSWCSAPVCDYPLAARLSTGVGYRSFAWAGGGFGTRVITNSLDPGGDDRTNRGTYLRLTGTEFRRMPGAGGNFRPSGAFASADDGWLEGPVQISAAAAPNRLRSWPVALRAPLSDVTPQPGAAPGALASQALAAGIDGGVARYRPGRGWRREFLLTSSGSVNKASLRGVAWPEAGRAHAVGDLGAMWQWNADNDIWEADPGTPVGFEGNLLDVAFRPGDPERGYAVGKAGVLLRYGKSWDQEALPAGFAGRDLTQVAFAGSQAMVAAGDALLVNDGGAWRVDASAKALLDRVRAGRPRLFAVAGLPDGGAVAAGPDIVIERDGPGRPWRFSNQPLPGSTVIALGAFRSSAAGRPVRAVASVAPRTIFPPPDEIPTPDPNVPPPIIPPFGLPGDGYVLRETDAGWIDEQRTAFSGSGSDRPIKSDPILGFALDGAGNGWAVGGWSGDSDSAGRGSSARNAEGRRTRTRVRTAGIYRYGSDSGTPPASTGVARVPLPPGPARLAAAGHAQCELACADLAPQALGPDRTLGIALGRIAAIRGGQGPRALLYTGGRARAGLSGAEAARYAALLGSQPSLPVYPALGSGDIAGGGAAAYKSAFAGFTPPFGDAGGARTHYSLDTTGSGGTVRVVVIDNSAGSLAASDPHQNPPEPQRPWLIATLADARARGIPTVVMGNRDLNTRFSPRLNTASDGDDVARLLVEEGASAYVFDRPEENRALRIPSGGGQTIPEFGTGTLGYRSPISGVLGLNVPDSLFGDSGYLLLEVDVAKRDAASNRAPVAARLIPVIEDLALEATDGTLLRRSRPALFRGLGRRPRGGDRWGRVAAGDGNPNPPGGDPYTAFPPEQCRIPGCATRIAPEYEFTSSDPDIADFVRQDPNSTNLRKPFLGGDGKVVTDAQSGLLCPFNAGTTTVTIKAGGFSFSETVTVQRGSVQRPCGTRPLRPDRFRRAAATATPPPPPPPAPAPTGSTPPVSFTAPAAAPTPAPVPAPPPAIVPAPVPRPPLALPPVPVKPVQVARVPTIAPPPPPPAVRPTPPGGAPGRVYQVEKEREEEAAPEQSKAFSRYEPDDGGPPAYLLGLVLIAALAGATVRGSPGRRRRTAARPAPATAPTPTPRGGRHQ